MQDDYVVVGIGCNINSKPSITSSGANGGRPATCIREHLAAGGAEAETQGGEEGAVDPGMEEIRVQLARDIMEYCNQWLHPSNPTTDSPASVQDSLISEVNSYISKEAQYIRLDNTAAGESVLGRQVIPLRVNRDGTLQVPYA